MTDVGTKNQSTRDAWVATRLAALPVGTRLLDAGAGERQYEKYCTHLNYTSQDFCAYDGAGDGVGLQCTGWKATGVDVISDIVRMPFACESFDAVLCTEVLEHVYDPIAALKELVRVLVPRGVLIVTAPFCCLTHQAPHFYHTGFSEYFYRRFSRENGMMISEVAPNGNFFEWLAQELRRVPTMVRKYTGGAYPAGTENLMHVALESLGLYSEADTGSSAMLSYGLQIVMVKNE